MDAIDRDQQLQRLKYLIESNSEGTTTDIASKITVSRATLYRFINHLKIREGKEIKYCKKRNCFYFEETE